MEMIIFYIHKAYIVKKSFCIYFLFNLYINFILQLRKQRLREVSRFSQDHKVMSGSLSLEPVTTAADSLMQDHLATSDDHRKMFWWLLRKKQLQRKWVLCLGEFGFRALG